MKVGERPKVLAGIAGLMCCSEEEVLATKRALMSFGGCVWTRRRRRTGRRRVRGHGGRLKVRLCQESRRRAGRYVAFILDQVELMACGSSGDHPPAWTPSSRTRWMDAWWATVRPNGGERGVRHHNVTLEEEAIKRDGGWMIWQSLAY